MGVASIWGFALVGIDAVPVRVEAHARSGLPGVTIVGLPGAAVREAKERVRSGAASSGLPLPSRRITINLSPGDVPKEGPGFDLPVALATLAACGYMPVECLRGVGAVGEVSLEGVVRPTRGALSVAESASRVGVGLLIAPIECLPAVSEVSVVPVVGVRSLAEAVLLVRDITWRDRLMKRGARWLRMRPCTVREMQRDEPDLADVVGHRQAKRALEVAAAGGHHLLMVGAPGAGKTMLARRLAGILPPLCRDEAVEVTRIWSAAGLQGAHAGLIRERPFRAPHHTASRAALVGGGASLRPGEVSLAHRGVLFLDELPEFSRDGLEALREPLEDRRVVISRRMGTAAFPAECTLVAAMNPCPCGYLGHPEKPCRCPAASVGRYRSRISGPLLDRVDALIEVPPLTLTVLEQTTQIETSGQVRERVAAAWEFRRERLARQEDRDGHPLEKRSLLTAEARALLRQALVRESLSARAYVRIVSLARTMADLDNVLPVGTEHIAEALALRLDQRRVDFS
ncbi:MAG: YifB family Mg chelatase-like AAA ATPase [Thermoleophilia bacterium]|nr:YifB family Mg chelatase-like AAA ATPase [Thermoleophilia bacterium]